MDGTSERAPRRSPGSRETEEHRQPTPDVPITAPIPLDPNWYANIQRAKEAREAGIRLRKNKPAAVITRFSPV